MLHGLTDDQIAQLLALFGGSYTIDALHGEVRLLGRPLPGGAVCALLPAVDGVTRIVYDLTKPNCLAHVQDMLRQVFESYAEPVAFPDGTVELVRRPCPRAGAGPLDLTDAV